MLAGLAAAHKAGIVHRDVKPENVLLGGGNVIKVADFGLARAASRASHTQTGMLIGTAAYLAPEQVARSVSDSRTDVYAAGVMLFEMLTGVQPHTGETPLAVAHKHVSDVVPAPSSVVPGLPPSLDALVALATNRDPDLRPGDAGQFLQVISDARSGLPVGGPADPPHGQLLPAPPSRVSGPVPSVDPAGFPWFDENNAPTGYGQPGSGFSPMPGNAYSPVPAVPANANHTLIVLAGGGGYGRCALRRHALLRGRRARLPGAAGEQVPQRAEPVLQRWLFSRRFVYLSLGIAAAVIIGLVAWWVTDGQFATVPQVTGMAVGTARSELQNLGFTVKVGQGEHSNTVAKGDVAATDPGSGTSAKRGATVTLIESTGPVMIGVPQVTGLTEAAAQAELKKAGLTPGSVTTAASDTIPVGVVISTNPVAGTSWPQAKPVGITVSAGPPLPNFVGQQFSAAQGEAQSGGYQLQQQTVSNSAAQGTIVGQSPGAGSPITKGEVVTVQVSNGPPEVSIPNVVGMNVGQATQELQQAGFQVTVTKGVFGGGTVSTESPTGQAPKGSTITLTTGFSFP